LKNPSVDYRIVMQQQPELYTVCAGIPNRSRLMLYDVINYNDVTSALNSYKFMKNVHFIGI